MRAERNQLEPDVDPVAEPVEQQRFVFGSFAAHGGVQSFGRGIPALGRDQFGPLASDHLLAEKARLAFERDVDAQYRAVTFQFHDAVGVILEERTEPFLVDAQRFFGRAQSDDVARLGEDPNGFSIDDRRKDVHLDRNHPSVFVLDARLEMIASAGQRAFHRKIHAVEIVGGDVPGVRGTDELLQGVAGQLARALVGGQDPALNIVEDDRIGRVVVEDGDDRAYSLRLHR